MQVQGGKVVEVRNLVKRFGEFVALDNISFRVDEGEIVGLIGPNGVVKATTPRIHAGLLSPTSGYVRVLGYDVVGEVKEN
jgi:ABC-2 type transport system ATP-binding protein